MRKLAIVCLAATFLFAAEPTDVASRVRAALTPSPDIEALRAIGPSAMPHLVQAYRAASEDERANIAEAWYQLRWQSDEAKAALMEDIDTPHESLRLQAQWALGHVSDDDDVVDTLARILQNDANPLFRDKAGCALAFDQIHLTESQKVRLYAKVIQALRDPKLQVRDVASRILQAQLGQQKGFRADAPPEEREQAVRAWERWVEEYKSNL
jgi:hypothetical protein